MYLNTLWRVADGLDVYFADLVAEPGNSRLDPESTGAVPRVRRSSGAEAGGCSR